MGNSTATPNYNGKFRTKCPLALGIRFKDEQSIVCLEPWNGHLLREDSIQMAIMIGEDLYFKCENSQFLISQEFHIPWTKPISFQGSVNRILSNVVKNYTDNNMYFEAVRKLLVTNSMFSILKVGTELVVDPELFTDTTYLAEIK
ncbi:MAG: hypothetical protein Homavirus39_4 [Homavirus sp.]|uniref:Uncharacterized protein n=1 Tax=Homavirus sp. TaxID=2487769 RepID=A0A3G5A565_9VIRU|nr:MAG: hypothetical protein Homavirus39_4 [Homavirus sp.]